MAQANRYVARTGSLWIWLSMSGHGHFWLLMGHLSVYYDLKVLCTQVHYILDAPGVSTLETTELRAGEMIVHLVLHICVEIRMT